MRNAINALGQHRRRRRAGAGQNDPEIRVVVLTGSGDKSFCAGADLKGDLARGEPLPPRASGIRIRRYVASHFHRQADHRRGQRHPPWVAPSWQLARDLIVAEESAKFGLPEVQAGLIAGAGGVFRIAEQLPRKVANELLFTGEPMSSADALRWGLINQVVPDGTVVDAALKLAERITGNAPLAVQASKRVAYGADEGVITGDKDGWKRTNREFSTLLQTEDAKEGPLAFAQKREPVWKAK